MSLTSVIFELGVVKNRVEYRVIPIQNLTFLFGLGRTITPSVSRSRGTPPLNPKLHMSLTYLGMETFNEIRMLVGFRQS